MLLANGSWNVNHILQFTNLKRALVGGDNVRRKRQRRRRHTDGRRPTDDLSFRSIHRPLHYATDINLILQRFQKWMQKINYARTNMYLTIFIFFCFWPVVVFVCLIFVFAFDPPIDGSATM